MFSAEPPLSFRPEVQKYIRACEHLLSAVASPDCKPLSNDERRLLEYYREKLVNAIGAVMKN